jgi:hypothetical protein
MIGHELGEGSDVLGCMLKPGTLYASSPANTLVDNDLGRHG